jgi:hypothetical protein
MYIPSFVESMTLLMLIGVLIGILLYHRKQARLMIDGLIAVLVTGIFASMLLQHREEQRIEGQESAVRAALAQLNEQALVYAVLKEVELGPSGLPVEISPRWFRQGLPMNAMVPGRQPWLDYAPLGYEGDNPPYQVI